MATLASGPVTEESDEIGAGWLGSCQQQANPPLFDNCGEATTNEQHRLRCWSVVTSPVASDVASGSVEGSDSECLDNRTAIGPVDRETTWEVATDDRWVSPDGMASRQYLNYLRVST